MKLFTYYNYIPPHMPRGLKWMPYRMVPSDQDGSFKVNGTIRPEGFAFMLSVCGIGFVVYDKTPLLFVDRQYGVCFGLVGLSGRKSKWLKPM